VPHPYGFPGTADGYSPSPRHPYRRRRVLVVDGHEDTREMLRVFLQTHQFEVADCGDAEVALEECRRFGPDVIILGDSLRKIDMLELANRLRLHMGLRLPRIVLLSGFGGSLHQDRALAAGCDDYLLKPVNLDELLRVVLASRRPSTPSVPRTSGTIDV
jgi:DNA-binding response OmpR family regulator